jgi:hypothetical protein
MNVGAMRDTSVTEKAKTMPLQRKGNIDICATATKSGL